MRPPMPKSLIALIAAVTVLAGAAGSAAAAQRTPLHSGESAHTPPRGAARAPITLPHSDASGVVYMRGSRDARVVKADCASSCVGPLFYWGGPVMLRPKVYAIFWDPVGKLGTEPQPSPEAFPPGYEATIEEFMGNVQASSSNVLSSVFSVDLLYGDEAAEGRYGWTFGGKLSDSKALPERETKACPLASPEEEEKEEEGAFGLPPEKEACVTDEQLREQIEATLEEEEGLSGGLGSLYFIFTPEKLNSCAGGEGEEAECTTNSYCAYHWDIPGVSESEDIVYANMPYGDRPGCETPDQPNAKKAGEPPPGVSPADDEINLVSHEGNEAITDPLGGEEGEEGVAWLAYSGNEIADLCTYPFFDDAIDYSEEGDAYGVLLGGVLAGEGEIGTAYNQDLNGGHYLLQREWSNAAKGCVAHAPIPTARFAIESSPATTGSPVTFDGSGSSAGAGVLDYYLWEFGDGGTATESASVTHTYTSPGTYTVTLTVGNDSGAGVSTTRQVTVEAPASPPKPVTTTIVTTTTATVTAQAPEEPVAHYSSNEIAKLIGLPPSGRRLGGLGRIALGKAECPPACSVSARIQTTVRAGKHRRHVWIGRAHLRLEAKQFGEVSIRLNGKGARLLRRHRHIHVRLIVLVGDREGASWHVSRSLTLTSGGKAAARRHSRHRGHVARRRLRGHAASARRRRGK